MTDMNDKTVIWVVGIQCRPEDELKFNRWYDDVHVPMLLQGNFVQQVSRFKLAPASHAVGAAAASYPNYLTIYQFESQQQFDAWMASPARAEAGDDKERTWGSQPYDVQWATQYNRVQAWLQQ